MNILEIGVIIILEILVIIAYFNSRKFSKEIDKILSDE